MLSTTRAGARRTLLLLTGCLALGLVVGGCTFSVVQPINPNDPLFQARNFVLEPLAMASLSIGGTPEAAYLAGKNPGQQQSWAVDKAEAARIFYDQAMGAGRAQGLNLVPPPPQGPGFFILRPVIDFIEPGTYTFFFNKDTIVSGALQILDEQGAVLDSTPLQARVRANSNNPSSGGRMRVAGDLLGQQLVHHVLRRTGARRY